MWEMNEADLYYGNYLTGKLAINMTESNWIYMVYLGHLNHAIHNRSIG